MAFQDKSIECSDCGSTFTFAAGEQEFFKSKGLTHEPKRCSWCRAANKLRRSDDHGDTFERRYESSMYLNIV